MATLNFNANEVEPSVGFDAIPAGKYQAVIVDSDMKPNKAGTGEYLQLEFEIIDGEYKGRKVWERLNLANPNAQAVAIARGRLSAICRAVGVMTPRDSILHHKRIMRASFVAIEPQTGNVKAYVGGPNFQYFKYDMAKQGKRQIGSTVKPFVYTFAIDHLGMTPCTMVPNLPVTIETAAGTAWSPKEAGKVEYDGVLHPLKWGLAHSRNNYSAWIMKQAKQPEAVADFIHNMGVMSFIDPVYALCLGTFESNVFELASAYSTFANEGVHNTPIFVTHIEDRQGNLISTFSSNSQDAISKNTAYTMLTMLKNVISNGTGRRMTWQFGFTDMDIAGKTGTSNDNRDAWFMCITPRLVAGAWVGGEDQSVHLRRSGEGSVMALPIQIFLRLRTRARSSRARRKRTAAIFCFMSAPSRPAPAGAGPAPGAPGTSRSPPPGCRSAGRCSPGPSCCR